MSDTPPQETTTETEPVLPNPPEGGNAVDGGEGAPFSFTTDPGDNVPGEVLDEFKSFFNNGQGAGGSDVESEGGNTGGDSGSGPVAGTDVGGQTNDLAGESQANEGQQQTSQPEAGNELGEQPDQTGAGDSAGETTAPVQSEGYTWVDGTDHQTFDNQTVQEGLLVLDWARKLPDDARTAIAAVTDGSAIPIPRADYEAFVNWKNGQQTQQTQQQNTQQRFDRDADLRAMDLEPEAMAAFQKTRDDLDALKAQIAGNGNQQQAPQIDPGFQQTVNQNMDGTAQAFDRAMASYAEQRGMTNEELTGLANQMLAMNILPSLTQQMATIHPVTGQVIALAPVDEVLSRAMDTALYQNPQLWESLMTRGQAASDQDGSVPPTTNLPVGDPVITAKKARASSVASAPSASTTPVPREISKLGSQELTNEIAAYLDKLPG